MRQCAKCGAQTENEPVTITLGPEVKVLDLCDRHIKPIQALFDLGHSGPDREASPVARRTGHAVIPID